MKKLFKVTIIHEYVIVADAEDLTKQEIVARRFANDAINDTSMYDLDINIEEYIEDSVPNWDNRCIPYGSDADKTIGEYL